MGCHPVAMVIIHVPVLPSVIYIIIITITVIIIVIICSPSSVSLITVIFNYTLSQNN